LSFTPALLAVESFIICRMLVTVNVNAITEQLYIFIMKLENVVCTVEKTLVQFDVLHFERFIC